MPQVQDRLEKLYRCNSAGKGYHDHDRRYHHLNIVLIPCFNLINTRSFQSLQTFIFHQDMLVTQHVINAI